MLPCLAMLLSKDGSDCLLPSPTGLPWMVMPLAFQLPISEQVASPSWSLATSSGHMITSPHFLLPLEDSVLLECHVPTWSQSAL